MPTLPNGVEFSYFKEGYMDGSDDRGPYVEVLCVVDWAERFRFVNGVRSNVTLTGPLATGGVLWALPWQYPDSPNLYAFDVRLVRMAGAPTENARGGFELVGDGGAPGQGIYAVTFRVPPFDLLGIDYRAAFGQNPFPFTSMRRSTGLQVEPIPGHALVFQDEANDGLEPPEKDFHVVTPVTELVFTRHQLPYMPTSAVDEFAGTVNASAFFDYPTGQVKFDGITAERRIDGGNGETVIEVELTFSRIPRDWNTAWSTEPGRGWQLVWSDPVNQLVPYPYADFNEVFSLV